MGDNGVMPMAPIRFFDQTKLESVVGEAINKLGKDVVRVRYSYDDDHTGEPSIFFRVVLTDAAAKPASLGKVASGVKRLLIDEIRPHENWGLHLYFNFRSKSETVITKDPDWD